jgi:diketogulonate reductase-like aldo/keto reductase
MRTVTLPNGINVPALGQGTWRMGEDARRRDEEKRAILAGIDAGMTLIDTAEMYGNGATEHLLGDVLSTRRDEVFLVSKAYPQNGSRLGLSKACEASLKRLRTDRLDLYLLHWRGSVPLRETVEGMNDLLSAGKIGAWGVSNFDSDDMEDLLTAGGTGCATNQVLYNLTRRGPEFDLIPWLNRRKIPLMAYSPIGQGRMPAQESLRKVAERHGATPMQIALAWTIRCGALAIPKASTAGHVAENARAADIVLSDDDNAVLDGTFRPPRRKVPLQML